MKILAYLHWIPLKKIRKSLWNHLTHSKTCTKKKKAECGTLHQLASLTLFALSLSRKPSDFLWTVVYPWSGSALSNNTREQWQCSRGTRISHLIWLPGSQWDALDLISSIQVAAVIYMTRLNRLRRPWKREKKRGGEGKKNNLDPGKLKQRFAKESNAIKKGKRV